jgi:hypothetical protein
LIVEMNKNNTTIKYFHYESKSICKKAHRRL